MYQFLKPYFFVLLLFSIVTGVQGQPGRIVFDTVAPLTGTGHSTNELSGITLQPRTNLFLTVSLQKPLSWYLQQMAPQLSVDSLSAVGNYQFNFYIDGRLIYHTELWPGAPRPQQQQRDTLWTKPLIDNQHEGTWWSQSAWNRFMYNGGDSALTEGRHTLRLVLRPYVNRGQLIVGDIIAEGSVVLDVNRQPKIDLATISLTPVKPYNGLAVSSDAFDRNRIKQLKAWIDAGVFRHVTSIVVLKKGKILVEEYFNGNGRDSLNDTRSVGKSFASTLTGMAIRDHYLESVTTRLGSKYALQQFAHYSAAKAAVTVRELLTMSSRFDGNDDDMHSPGNEENMYPTDDWVKFTLDLPMDTVKYTGQWHYFTAGVMLQGSLLHQLIPGGLESYADKNLFRPLGITHYQWQFTPQQAPNTAGGIRLRSLDLAKYGQLYVNRGRWNGRQVLPEHWVKESFTHQLPIPGRTNEYYGYLFWNKTYSVKERAMEAWYCTGNGGNKVFVFKDPELVVVITATAYGQPYAHPQADRMMTEYILPAVIGSGP
ncbi:serine hydrolase domain-containing protein [Flavihumibacter petaseus]|uniref:Peptidase S12 family protein n=1 Tax=Flavihumibacter petaseus NBRC 106054 TaxID=1220578 RepID=A0A0E9N164_9BACT|nr:serine hydrolase [Flavihumibacter petaseus]GAO43376.1 peptidase S12 family protein [Flavihumibacter petaseus NBRC 106054]